MIERRDDDQALVRRDGFGPLLSGPRGGPTKADFPPEARDALTDPDTYKGLGAAILASILAGVGLSKRRRKNEEIAKLKNGGSGP